MAEIKSEGFGLCVDLLKGAWGGWREREKRKEGRPWTKGRAISSQDE